MSEKPPVKAGVLFVDDEPDVTESIRVALRSEPFTVYTANSAEDGLELLARESIDVVVSDERMPGMSGAGFLTAVRDRFPSTSRIILTGQATVEATIAAVNDAKVFRVLTKPCPVPEIVACINAAIAEGQSVAKQTVDRSRASAELDEALDSLAVAYQPIYSLRDDRVAAYEALVRPVHERLSSPTELIDTTTNLDRFADLDRRVCSVVAADVAHLPAGASVFVNLLPQSLGDPLLIEGLDLLAEHADRVALEVTERAQLDPSLELLAHLDALRERGFQIVLDDLGAGYAGLNSFVTLKPDIVKFDMELVRSIHESETSSKLVASMIGVCTDLGIVTVGEGVETPAELRHLADLGIDLVQGFLLARPSGPWADVDAAFRSRAVGS